MKVRCPECGWNGDIRPVPVTDIPGVNERLDPGGVVPAGVCPSPAEDRPDYPCGSLVYPTKEGYVARTEHSRSALLLMCRAVFEIIESTYPHDDDGNREEGDSPVSGADVVQELCCIEESLAEAIAKAERL